MRRMPRISVGSFASVAHPAWRKTNLQNIDSGLFRRLGLVARLLKKLGFLYGNISTAKCVSGCDLELDVTI